MDVRLESIRLDSGGGRADGAAAPVVVAERPVHVHVVQHFVLGVGDCGR